MGDTALHSILPAVVGELEAVKYINFLLALRCRRERAETVVAKPIDTTIDLTTMCHLHCPYCAVGNGTMQRPKSRMKKDQFQKLVDELGDTTFITWYFSTGEPLLHSSFSELISQTKGKQIFGAISTNLSLPLSDERLDKILQSGISLISVSLDGASAETYSQYRVGGNFELVLDNIKRLVIRKKQLGLDSPLIEWRFLVFEHNQHEIETARRMAKAIGVDLLEFYPGFAFEKGENRPVKKMTIQMPNPSIQGPALDKSAKRTDTTLRKHIKHNADSTGPGHVETVSKCDWLYLSGMIYPNGAFGPCCVSTQERDDFTNLHDHETFGAAWNSKLFVDARRAFREGTKSGTVCDRCPLPLAQHYQFVQKLRGILLNAPDWVLKVLQESMDKYFFEFDRKFIPQELNAIRSVKVPGFDAGPIKRAFADYAAKDISTKTFIEEMQMVIDK